MEYEFNADDVAMDKREYWWNLAGAVLLSCAALASAWCTFQAASWDNVFAVEARTASVARMEVARQSAIADRQRETDVLLFMTWAEAEFNGQAELADAITHRFTQEFRPAFEAWHSSPASDGRFLPDGSPFDRPEYMPAALAATDAANTRAYEADVAADTAAAHSNRYVLSTVLFASVLFLAGIASKLTHRGLSHAVVILAGLALLAAIGVISTLPVNLSGS